MKPKTYEQCVSEAIARNVKEQVDRPLGCAVEGNELVIRIGVGTLAWAAKKRNGGPIPNRVRIADKHDWAKDVANSLQHEDEVGNSMLTEILDRAMRLAMDMGSTGLNYK